MGSAGFMDRFTGGPQEGSGGIPRVRKVCFALGGAPHQITTAAIGISLQIFLLDVVKMEAFYVSMVLFVSRAWDAVTDPLVGYLVSRSKWTAIGKLTPWLVISTPFAVLSYLLLWFQPKDSMSEAASVLWFLTATCLFETLMSCYNVPYLSLNMFLGGRQRDRDSATAYRMSVEMTAMLLASLVQGHVVSVYNTEKQKACELPDQQAAPSTSAPQAASLQETQKAFVASALVMGALFFLCSTAVFFGVREQRAPGCPGDRIQPSYVRSVRMLLCHVPYQRLLLGFVFSVSAFQMSLGNFALFCSHAAGLGSQFQLLLLVLLVSATVAVPLWQIVLLRIGKKATLFIGLSLFLPAAVVVGCVPSSLPVFMTMCVVMGFSVATVFLLPWSMLPDVVDDFALRHPPFKELEPLFFSGYAFCSKLAGGLSAGLSTLTLQIAGYDAGACGQGDGVVTALIVLFSPVPITLLLVAMVLFHTYPINERQHPQLKEEQLQRDATSPPRGRGEQTELPAVLQRSCTGVTSTPHPDPKTSTPYQSGSSPRYREDGSLSVKSSTTSHAAHSPCGKSRSSPSHVQSKINPIWKKVKVSPNEQPGAANTTANTGGTFPGSFSGGTEVPSKVSWV
ncbi:sodium-dependent lysophosphatidylcholine symporter 1-B-like [Cololabis saira]|uniref:sodium-dependent lysophosphatidylcholine symporter 1-B-like n=1 Tax=Cololabis saira TaxID=129043 RepID=UPI002AD2D87C|nr:sodium-dependent lysophosphatidylcholine symporter 1-B-like [Cololabis saira]